LLLDEGKVTAGNVILQKELPGRKEKAPPETSDGAVHYYIFTLHP